MFEVDCLSVTQIRVPVVVSGWWYADSEIDLDFANNRLWTALGGENSDFATYLSCSRASTAYAPTSANSLTQFGTDTLRITDLGLLREAARTNVVLWDRDLTNAAWTKTNVTAAKDQTGPDGVSNSASSITATAGNGTALQSITLGSSDRFQSAWVKRLIGSGTINMTMDNGSTWTAITVTAGWTRVTIPTQTLANPIVGFRIVTNGDSIAVDFVQNEDGTFGTSPIETTTASTTRASDVIVSQSGQVLRTTVAGTTGSLILDLKAIVTPPTKFAWIGDTVSEFSTFYTTGGDNQVWVQKSGGAQLNNDFTGFGAFSAGVKTGVAWNPSGRSITAGGDTVDSDANAWGCPDFQIGREVSFSEGYFYSRRLTAWSSKLADATLASRTA